MSDEKNTRIHAGHRGRMKEKIIRAVEKNEEITVDDHVLLEILLYFGIPQKDTNVMAHELINKFGSFSRVFEARFEDLKSVKGMTENAACLIKMLLPVYKRYVEDSLKKASDEEMLLSAEKIVGYMRTMYAGSYDEKVYLLCFDGNRKLIATEKIGSGDVSQAFISMRELARIILSTGTREVILVHNHPYSIALPSSDDIKTTQNVYSFLKTLKVRLVDHIIISKEGFCSMVSVPRFMNIFYGKNPGEKTEN